MVGVDRLESVHSPDVTSMQPKNDLMYFYESKVLSVTSSEARSDGRCEVSRKIKINLQSVEPKLRMPELICDALEICIRSDDGVSWRPSKAVEGLRAIESYALNLWDFPWKKEFHIISTFSGYYKTRIEINIGLAADKLFALIGYRRVGAFLRLDVVPGREQLRSAAADLMQAAVECEIQETILEVVLPYGVSALDVFSYRRSKPGSMADCIERLKRINSAAHFVVEGDVGTGGKISNIKGENEGLNKKTGVYIGGSEGAHIGGGHVLSLQEDDIDHERQRENEEKQFGSFADPPPPPTTLATSRVTRPAPPPPPPHASGGTHRDSNIVTEISSRGNPVVMNTRLDEAENIEAGVQYGFPTTERWNEGSAKKKPTVSPSKAPFIWGDTDVMASERSFDRTAGSDRSQYLSTFKRESADDRPSRFVTVHGRLSPSDVTIDGVEDRSEGGRFDCSEARRLNESDGLVGRGVGSMNLGKDAEMNDMATVLMNLAPEQLADSSVRERFLTKRTGVHTEPLSTKPSDKSTYELYAEPVARDPTRSLTSRMSTNSKPTSTTGSRQVVQPPPFSDSSLVTSRAQRGLPSQSPQTMYVRTTDADVRSGTRQERLENPSEYRLTELVGRSAIQANYLPPSPAANCPIYSEVRSDRVREEKPSTGQQHTVSVHWTCQRCTLLNDPQAIECAVCGASKTIKLFSEN